MATELEQFRDHCRKQSTATEIQRPKCASFQCSPPWRNFGAQPDHAACTWGWQTCACSCHDAGRPPPPTDADRLLWTRLADEIDAYLAGDLCPDCGEPIGGCTDTDFVPDPALWEDA